jgi:acyl carrier protein
VKQYTETVKWLVLYFEQRSDENVDGKIDIDANYLSDGYIDSFGIIELISEVESNFNIAFNEKHFQDPKFPIISGLGKIIDDISSLNK